MNISFYRKYQNLYDLCNSIQKFLGIIYKDYHHDKYNFSRQITRNSWLLRSYVQHNQRIRKRELPKISNDVLSLDKNITHRVLKINYDINQYQGINDIFRSKVIVHFLITEIASLQNLLQFALITHASIHQVISKCGDINYNDPTVRGLGIDSTPVNEAKITVKRLIMITSGLQNYSIYFKDIYNVAKKMWNLDFNEYFGTFFYNKKGFQARLHKLYSNRLNDTILYIKPYKKEN